MVYNPLVLRVFKAFAVSSLILLNSCSTPEGEDTATPVEPEPEIILPFNISVFAAGNENIHQINILDTPENREEINLTQTLGVPWEFQEVAIHGSKITFFGFGGGSYGFWQKEVITGNTLKQTPICELQEEENGRFPLVSEEKVGILVYVSTGHLEGENYYKIYDPAIGSCSRFSIDDPYYIHDRSRARLHKDRFYLYSPEDPAGPSLLVISADTGENLGKLTFANYFRTTMSEELIYLIFPNGDYKTYNISDLNLQDEGTTGNLPLPTTNGIFSSTFKGSKMVFDYPYAQPSPISSAPAVYDWATNTISQGGDYYLSDAIRSVSTASNQSLGLTVSKVNLEKNIVVAGYKDYGHQNKGGVLYLNFEGEVLLNIPLDYVPFEILIRD